MKLEIITEQQTHYIYLQRKLILYCEVTINIFNNKLRGTYEN